MTYIFSHSTCCSFLPRYVTWVLYFANDISVISSTEILLIFICNRVTPGLCRYSVTLRSDTGALPMPGAEPWCIGTHRDTPKRLRGYTGNPPPQTVASPGQTVITSCPKSGLVRSTDGNVWAHSNSFTIRPGSTRSAGYKLTGRTGAYTGQREASFRKQLECVHTLPAFIVIGYLNFRGIYLTFNPWHISCVMCNAPFLSFAISH